MITISFFLENMLYEGKKDEWGFQVEAGPVSLGFSRKTKP